MSNVFVELLEFENRSNVLEYRFQYKNMLMWPFVRYDIFAHIIDKEIYQGDITSISNIVLHEKETFCNRIVRRTREMLRAYMSKVSIPQKDILFLSHSGANVKNADGKVYNRLWDEYALIFPEKTAMLESPIDGYSSKDRVFSGVISSRYLDYKIWLKAKMKRQSKRDIVNIDAFVQYIQHNFPYELGNVFLADLRIRLFDYAKKIGSQDKVYRKFFMQMKPKVVFVAEACYGCNRAFLVWMLHDMQIPVYEIQHGLVHQVHSAYNYSHLIFENKEYLEYLPDKFFVFGEFWKKHIELPVSCQVMGSANFTESINKRTEVECEIASRILIVLNYDPMMELIDILLSQLDDKYSIVVKPHPLYQSVVDALEIFKENDKFSIVREGNIFDSIIQAEYVIGDYSTVLYEATGCGKKVFVYRHELTEMYISKEIGNWFSTPEELVELLRNGKAIKKNDDVDYYFNSHWKEKYRNMIADTIYL